MNEASVGCTQALDTDACSARVAWAGMQMACGPAFRRTFPLAVDGHLPFVPPGRDQSTASAARIRLELARARHMLVRLDAAEAS